jgi:cytochrome bd ubiquinol oxidase subunit II
MLQRSSTALSLHPWAGMETFWYLGLAGLATAATLTMERALWIALNKDGEDQARAKRLARTAWWAVAALTALIATLSFQIRPRLADIFLESGWGLAFPTLAMAGLIGVRLWDKKETELLTFFSSTIYVCGMITSAVFGGIV